MSSVQRAAIGFDEPAVAILEQRAHKVFAAALQHFDNRAGVAAAIAAITIAAPGLAHAGPRAGVTRAQRSTSP